MLLSVHNVEHIGAPIHHVPCVGMITPVYHHEVIAGNKCQLGFLGNDHGHFTNMGVSIPNSWMVYNGKSQKQLDDGWPESVEEQGLLLLVWRHNFTNNI